jgi:hypothetical protein
MRAARLLTHQAIDRAWLNDRVESPSLDAKIHACCSP